MRKATGCFVCLLILIVWNMIGVGVFGWKHGGGAIPTLIIMTILIKVYGHFSAETPAEGSPDENRCQHCNHKFEKGESFCRNCGKPISKDKGDH